jgi:hypothetical protein
MSLTETQCKDQVESEIGELKTRITLPDDIDNAVALAASETGWTFPLSTTLKDYWIKNRSKRHIFAMLCGESAYKFKFKQINLQNRFEHFRQLVRMMDQEWNTFKKENPFAIAPSEEFNGISKTHIFGTVIDAGFNYDDYGQDVTYDDGNLVVIAPTDSD